MSDHWVKNRQGFTLVELIVVMVLIGILLAIASLDFRTYQTRYKIDAQVKEMSSGFQDLRLAAIEKKKPHGIRITPTAYTFLRYSSEADAAGGAGTVIETKQVNYRITTLAGADLTALVKFDYRGYVNGVNPPSMAIGLGSGVTNAPTDCLVMSVTRVNMGKLNGGVCEFK